jgi:tape measure domain-containing protein
MARDANAALIVSLESRLNKFEKDMAKATKLADKAADDIEKRFTRINPNLSGLTNSIGKLGLAIGGALGANEIREAADAFTKVQNALKVTGLQGDQLRAVYDQLFASAQRQGTSIESTVGLYSKLAGAQKDLNATQGELLRFTEGVGTALRVAGTDATAASGALLQLGQALGGGKIQAEEYNSIIDGARPILQAVANGLVEAGGSVSKLTALVKDGQVSSEAFFRAFLAGLPSIERQAETSAATSSQAFERVKNSLINLVGQLDETLKVSPRFNAGIVSMAQTIDGLTGKIVGAIKALQEFNVTAGQAITKGLEAAKVGTAATQESALVAQIESLKRQNPTGVVGGDALRLKGLEEQLARARAVQARGGAPAPSATAEPLSGAEGRIGSGLSRPVPVSLKQFPVTGDKKGGGGGGGAETLDAYERQVEAIKKREAALKQEATTIGQSAFEVERARAAFELMTAAKAAEMEITPGLLKDINDLATAYAQADQSVRAAKDAQAQMNELARFTGQTISSFFSDIVSGGKNAEEALMNLVKRLADAALQAALLGDGPLAALFGTKGENGAVGGLFGALFSGLFSGFGTRASGGTVSANKPYLVGEAGPELMIPGKGGMVVPNNALSAAMGGGAPSVTVNQVFNNPQQPLTRQELLEWSKATKEAAIAGTFDALRRGRG